jgi:hypothetical protein
LSDRKSGGEIREKISYNFPLDRERFGRSIAEPFVAENYSNLGLYLMMPRFVRPYSVSPLPARHDHPINALPTIVIDILFAPPLFRECGYAGSTSYDVVLD